MLDGASSVSYAQAVFSLREKGKKKVYKNDSSDHHTFFCVCLQEIWGYFPIGTCSVL